MINIATSTIYSIVPTRLNPPLLTTVTMALTYAAQKKYPKIAKASHAGNCLFSCIAIIQLILGKKLTPHNMADVGLLGVLAVWSARRTTASTEVPVDPPKTPQPVQQPDNSGGATSTTSNEDFANTSETSQPVQQPDNSGGATSTTSNEDFANTSETSSLVQQPDNSGGATSTTSNEGSANTSETSQPVQQPDNSGGATSTTSNEDSTNTSETSSLVQQPKNFMSTTGASPQRKTMQRRATLSGFTNKDIANTVFSNSTDPHKSLQDFFQQLIEKQNKNKSNQLSCNNVKNNNEESPLITKVRAVSSNEEIRKLNQKVKTLEEHNQALRAGESKDRLKIDKLKKGIRDLKTQLKDLGDTHSELKRTTSEQYNELTAKEMLIKKQSLKISNLENKDTQGLKDVQEYNDDLIEQAKKITDLRKQIYELEQTIEDQTKKHKITCDQQKTEINFLNKSLDEATGRINQLTAASSELIQDRGVLQDTVIGLFDVMSAVANGDNEIITKMVNACNDKKPVERAQQLIYSLTPPTEISQEEVTDTSDT